MLLKKSVPVLIIYVFFFVTLKAQPVQINLSVDLFPNQENPYQEPVQTGVAEENIHLKGFSLEIAKRKFLSSPFISGLATGFLTGKLMESNSDGSEFCPNGACDNSFRSDLRIFSGELFLLYPITLTNNLYFRTGLRGGLTYLTIRDRFGQSEEFRSEYAPTFSPLLELGLNLNRAIGITTKGYYRFLKTDVKEENKTTVPVKLSGFGVSMGLSYNFN
ncbi:hypothetical protein [Gracilimonas mengyeensis]|uniref:Uncharacterized protein n=1 Tax=Gracilimonas mengyeensis TaxID=1302730 RepID=A0A521D148_9BACT|nr:hypothetical protein [Gracilimonas mengyeensis]SMO65382.1 hypothetical protein SAMN06265219_10720 [Gracilimonas mengyeensis]